MRPLATEGAAMFGVVSPELATPRYWERAGKESNVGEFVSIGAPLTQHDTATRSGDCLRVWRLDGVAFESAEFNLVKDRHDAWCNVLRNLPAGRTAIYHHRIHRRIHDRLTDATEPEFSAAFSKAYQDRISVAPMMSNELYITLLYRPFPSELAKRSTPSAVRNSPKARESAAGMKSSAPPAITSNPTTMPRW